MFMSNKFRSVEVYFDKVLEVYFDIFPFLIEN